MGSLGLVHWTILVIALATYVVPTANILKRTGFSRWFTLLALIPLVNVICFWIFAFAQWPRDRA